DVNYQVAREFVNTVKQKALGEEVLLSVTPGQQVVKIFHDELVALLRGGESGQVQQVQIALPGNILLIGLNGAGKTTTAAKLGRYLQRQSRRVGLVACDLARPAAIEQLATLGEQLGLPVWIPPKGEKNVINNAKSAQEWAKREGFDATIFDTAGRQEINEELLEELVNLRNAINPSEVLLICDAATGQAAVNVAERFHSVVGISGCILTKLDGDARGGVALSLRKVTGVPIKFCGTGEKLDQLEFFYPERLASRILGMGDVVSLVEKAAQAIDEREAEEMQRRLASAKFDLNDLLAQMQLIKKMGPLENLLGMLPGLDKIHTLKADERQFRRTEAIILSMTPQERAKPEIINARRRRRIAAGSGVTLSEVNNLLLQFQQMRKMMRKAGGLQKLLKRMKHLPPIAHFPKL
ncbi:MAG: signal recognition particle protein, partial [Chthoniobacterales bacterium]|nr:signal recognition particle protein [Chthoniobacterales bacterium]